MSRVSNKFAKVKKLYNLLFYNALKALYMSNFLTLSDASMCFHALLFRKIRNFGKGF